VRDYWIDDGLYGALSLHPHRPLRVAHEAPLRIVRRREDVHLGGLRPDLRLPQHGGDQVPTAVDDRCSTESPRNGERQR
jgi:hypothetical protein